jgi:uncharacterized coiled-coil protein SlyX
MDDARITELAQRSWGVPVAQIEANIRAALAEQREEDARDAARLDWLAEELMDCEINGANPLDHAAEESDTWPQLWRKAIDAARGKQ